MPDFGDRLRADLGPELAADTEWLTTDDRPQGTMVDLLRSGIWDINKPVHYFDVYEAVFGPRDRPVRILELGVSFGGSLELWRAYFTNPDAVIVGADANPKCTQFDHPEANVHVRIGKQQDAAFLQALIDEFGPFDIIVDDASHIPSFTLQSFRTLFVNGLADGGVYLVEDLHTSYAEDCTEPFPEVPWLQGANDGSPTFVEFTKTLIDVMHAHYLQLPTGADFDKVEPGSPEYVASLPVMLATKLIKSIEMHDQIVVIRRGPRDLLRMVRRWSRERMTTVLDKQSAQFLDDHQYLGDADSARRDWLDD